MNISSDDAIPIRKLDDNALVQKFVEGESSLLSNQNLRVETTFDAVTLMAKKEGVVATIKEIERKRSILVRYKSQYWQLVHNALLNHSFIPINYPDQQGFIQYQRHEIPPGYQVSYAEARLLWKEWWVQRRKYSAQSIQLDILIFIRDKWYPVREIISNEGVLFITTLVGDTILSGADQVAWLSRLPKAGVTPGVVSQLQARRVIQPNESTAGETTIIDVDPSIYRSTMPSAQDREDDVPTVDLSNPAPESSPPQSVRPPFIPGVTGRGVGAARVSGHPSLPLSGGAAPRKLPDLAPQPAPPPSSSATDYVRDPEATWVDPAKIPVSPGQPEEVHPTPPPPATPVVVSQPQPYPDVSPLVDIGAVLRFGQGRLYISTAIGELVVEGTDLKFWLTRSNEPS